MTSFRLPRHRKLLLLVYVAADFMDPSIPADLGELVSRPGHSCCEVTLTVDLNEIKSIIDGYNFI